MLVDGAPAIRGPRPIRGSERRSAADPLAGISAYQALVGAAAGLAAGAAGAAAIAGFTAPFDTR